MAVPLLDLAGQYASIQNEIDAAVAEVIRSQRFILGPVVDNFEAAVASRTGSAHAVGCASGTDAILLSLKALPLEAGAEIICPAFTFFATAGAVWNAGLVPVFADIDARTFNMTAETIEAAITTRTKAVIVVHLYGQMADMASIMELAARRGLYVIEDAAQSIGSRQVYRGSWKESGTIGVTGCLSFFPSKNLGAFGDAGMILVQDDEIAERLRKLRVHGGRQMYHHEMVGTNSRLDSLQAAVLQAKLPHLDNWSDARRRNADHYDSALRDVDGVKTPFRAADNHHVFNQYTLRAQRRDDLKKCLDANGIGNAIYYPVPLHLQECFASLGYKEGDLPLSEQAAREAISIPVYPELTPAQLDAVAGTIRDFYRN